MKRGMVYTRLHTHTHTLAREQQLCSCTERANALPVLPETDITGYKLCAHFYSTDIKIIYKKKDCK